MHASQSHLNRLSVVCEQRRYNHGRRQRTQSSSLTQICCDVIKRTWEDRRKKRKNRKESNRKGLEREPDTVCVIVCGCLRVCVCVRMGPINSPRRKENQFTSSERFINHKRCFRGRANEGGLSPKGAVSVNCGRNLSALSKARGEKKHYLIISRARIKK